MLSSPIKSRRSGSGEHLKKQSGRKWAARGGRGLIALVALALGIASISGSLSNVIVKADVRVANRLALADGRIMAALAAEEFSASPSIDRDSAPAILAKRALMLDPTAVKALRVLGTQAQLRSEEALAERLFTLSTALSRRGLQPQLWMIERAVARGDIDRALYNYDLAIRTSTKGRNLLFPVLASAIIEPRVRAALIDILAADPPWVESFVQYVPNGNVESRALVKFFQEGTQKGLPIEDAERSRVVYSLARRDLMEEAWEYYTSIRPGVVRDRSRDPGFIFGGEVSTPFDWNLGNAQSLFAAILQEGESGFLEFAAPPSTRTTVVRQTQLLPAGDYRLDGRGSGIDQPKDSRPYWVLSCKDGPEIGRVNVPNSNGGESTFSAIFTVPPACSVQVLSLVIRSSDKISGVSGRISHLQLVPVDNREISEIRS